MTTPLQNLPSVTCQDCDWERRALREGIPVLILAGLQHMTATDGHEVVLDKAEVSA